MNSGEVMDVVMATNDAPAECGDSAAAPSQGGDVEEKMDTDDVVNEIDDKPSEIKNDVSKTFF